MIIQDNWKKLAIFERIQIYQRDRSCVYDSEEDKTSAATVLHDLLFGEWNQVEKEMLKSGEERLKDLTNRMVVRTQILKYNLLITFVSCLRWAKIF